MKLFSKTLILSIFTVNIPLSSLACEVNLVPQYEERINNSSIPKEIHLNKKIYDVIEIRDFLDEKFFTTYKDDICNMGGVFYADEAFKIYPFGVYEIKFQHHSMAEKAYHQSLINHNRIFKPRKVGTNYKFYLKNNSLFIFRIDGPLPTN